MDGLRDEARHGDEGTAQQPEPQGADGQAAQAQVTGAEDDAAAKAREDYKAALEGEIAEAAETAESTEKLRAEMDELRRQGDEQRIGLGLQMAGCRSVKAARTLLDDHGVNVAVLKEAASWLFEGGAPKQAEKTGLPNARAAFDEGKTMERWREIAGIADEGQPMVNSITAVKNYTTI